MAKINKVTPGPGQESVWDYPRPPRLEDSSKRIQVIFNGLTIADSRRAKRFWKQAIRQSTTSLRQTLK